MVFFFGRQKYPNWKTRPTVQKRVQYYRYRCETEIQSYNLKCWHLQAHPARAVEEGRKAERGDLVTSRVTKKEKPGKKAEKG